MSALAVATGPADREIDDLDLVAAVRAGDDRAFETLFLRYQPRVAAYVGGMVRDHGRAEDITQEVFMSALRRLREDDERQIVFRPWIYEIAKNKCIDAYRRGRHTNEVSFDAHDQVGPADHGRLAGPGTTPDAAVEGKVAFDNLRGAFGGLSPVHHDILVMREFEGLSYREIGERLGMSRPAVESTLFRARKRLGEEYDELVSGRRCLRVQRIVEESGLRGAGLRDQRRVARHLAHCQPCRRHAHLAGAHVELLRPAGSAAARVAAFLPLPAVLRRRWNGEEAGQILSQQAARPAPWTVHVAEAIDPSVISGWAKLAATAATAATVALAGVGGAAVEHRAPVLAAPAAGAATPAAEQARTTRTAQTRRVAPGAPLPAQAAAMRARSEELGAPAAGTARPGAGATGVAPADGTGDPPAPDDPLAVIGPHVLPGDPPPAPPVGDVAAGTLAPLLGIGRGSAPAVASDGGGTDATTVPRPGRLLGGLLAPPPRGAAADANRDPATAEGEPAAAGASDRRPVGGLVEGVHDTLRHRTPTGDGASVPAAVSDSATNPTAAP